MSDEDIARVIAAEIAGADKHLTFPFTHAAIAQVANPDTNIIPAGHPLAGFAEWYTGQKSASTMPVQPRLSAELFPGQQGDVPEPIELPPNPAHLT